MMSLSSQICNNHYDIFCPDWGNRCKCMASPYNVRAYTHTCVSIVACTYTLCRGGKRKGGQELSSDTTRTHTRCSLWRWGCPHSYHTNTQCHASFTPRTLWAKNVCTHTHTNTHTHTHTRTQIGVVVCTTCATYTAGLGKITASCPALFPASQHCTLKKLE